MSAINTSKLSSGNLMIVMLLITLLVLGIATLAAKALITTIARDTTVVQKKTAAEKQLDKNIEAAPNLIASYGKLGPNSLILADALPNTADFPSILVTLENISAFSGTKLKGVTPANATPLDASLAPATAAGSVTPPAPATYKFGMSVGGSYDAVLKELAALETSARPMRVVDAQFSGSGKLLNVLLTLETYYQDKAKLPFGTETVK